MVKKDSSDEPPMFACCSIKSPLQEGEIRPKSVYRIFPSSIIKVGKVALTHIVRKKILLNLVAPKLTF